MKSWIFISLLLLGCGTAKKTAVSCDETKYHEWKTDPCGFRICYPRDWVDSYPDRGFRLEKYEPGFTLQDDSMASVHAFTNLTLGGRNKMGNFKEYIDSSRKQMLRDVNDLTILRDVDTVYDVLQAHWFVYYMRFSYREDTVKVTQLAIDHPQKHLQYILSFTHVKGMDAKYEEQKKVFFDSFEPSKKCD